MLGQNTITKLCNELSFRNKKRFISLVHCIKKKFYYAAEVNDEIERRQSAFKLRCHQYYK
jgi:hypothetical protein